MCHVAAADRATPPFPQGVTHSDPEHRPTPEHKHHGVPSATLTLGVVLDRTAECCVRHSRAGRMRAQKAVLPHSHGEGPQVLGSCSLARVHELAALPGLGSARWHWAVLPLFTNATFPCLRGTAASPRFITVLPLPASPIQNASAAGLKHLSFSP